VGNFNCVFVAAALWALALMIRDDYAKVPMLPTWRVMSILLADHYSVASASNVAASLSFAGKGRCMQGGTTARRTLDSESLSY